MTCAWFTERLDDLLAGTLRAGELARAEAHAANCPRCREVHDLLVEASGRRPDKAPGDLVDAVLLRTSGPPCEQARDRLGDLLDGGLDRVDGQLVEAHLHHCADCAALAAAAARLGDELPAFAELPAPPELAAAVLARTRRRPRRRVSPDGRWQDAVRRLLTRPRIAWEAGCVAALVLWLVFGASWSPLRTTAVEARALFQQGLSDASRAGAESVASINRVVAVASERAARAAARGANDAARRFAGPWHRAAAAAPDIDRHWRQLVQALEDRNVFAGVDALRSLSRDAGVMLTELLSPSYSTAATDDASRPAERSRP